MLWWQAVKLFTQIMKLFSMLFISLVHKSFLQVDLVQHVKPFALHIRKIWMVTVKLKIVIYQVIVIYTYKIHEASLSLNKIVTNS